MKKSKSGASCRKTSIGGQALLEGIMMRGPQKSAMAVRRPNGEIYFEEHETEKKKRPAICRWPLIRGIFGFVDSMIDGYRYLMRSAAISTEEVEPADTAPAAQTDASTAADTPTADASPEARTANASPEAPTADAASAAGEEPKSAFGKGVMTAVMVTGTVLGIGLAIVLFIWLPTLLYSLLARVLPEGAAENRYLRSVFEGLLKIAILVAYMALVSLMKDIRRTFMYHGAEHKTIFCYEHGLPLTVANVRTQRRFHPRCGTSFLILMLLVGIVIGIFIPPSIEGINPTVYTFVRTAIKILLIPLTMGVGYELLRFAGRHENLFTRILSAPGMWLQHITVREPTDDMIECAIRAFVAVMPEEERGEM